MSNPEILPGFVRITAVHDEYKTSRKSVERRRDRARDAGDTKVYKAFRLRTKDAEVLTEPSLEQVKSLRAEGRVPEWYVSRGWLAKEFGKRVGESASQATPHLANTNSDATNSLASALNSQIQELRTDKQRLMDQLDKERQERIRINELHDRDKERLSERSKEDRNLMSQLHQLMAKMEGRLAVPAQTQTIDGNAIERGSRPVLSGSPPSQNQIKATESSAATNPAPDVGSKVQARRWQRWLGL